MPPSCSWLEYRRDLNFLLLPLNWISQLPPEVCASGPVLADSQTNGPLHEVDGIQHQRKEQFGLEWCQDLFVLNQIPACIEIFFSHCCCASLLYVGKDESLCSWAGLCYHYLQCPNKNGVGLFVMWEIPSHFPKLVALGNDSECCKKLPAHGILSSASIWSSLHLFLSQIQQRKLRLIIVIMWQGAAERRGECSAPAEFF